jgi:CRISPR-associated protein Cas2
MKQFYLVSYDISDDRRRTKIMKTLEDFGQRVQYSVFECNLESAQITKLKKMLLPHVKDSADTIRIYAISADDLKRIEIIGNGKVTRERDFYMQ